MRIYVAVMSPYPPGSGRYNKLSGGCIVSARATESIRISYAEGEVGVIAWLMGYPEACLGLHLPSTERASSPTSFVFYPDFFFSGSRSTSQVMMKNLRIHLGLLGYKEYLNLHLQVLLKYTCSVFLVSHHVWRKLTIP